jgi:hypothetical protein
MHRFILSIAASLILVVEAGCGLSPQQVRVLPSGKQIKVLTLMTVSVPSYPSVLMLKYQTDLPIDDAPALQAEADEVMEGLKVDAEQAKVARAIVSANEPRRLIFMRGKSHNFLYLKQPDGTWTQHDLSKAAAH